MRFRLWILLAWASVSAAREFDLTKPIPIYSKDGGYGYEPGFAPGERKPFFFSVDEPDGNYRVTVKFGDHKSASDNTVFAELRRLMIEHVHTDAGKFVTRSFLVNVRQPAIPGTGTVRLNDRERTTEAWAWDNRLTLEFNGAHPAVASVKIEPVNVPVLYL